MVFLFVILSVLVEKESLNQLTTISEIAMYAAEKRIDVSSPNAQQQVRNRLQHEKKSDWILERKGKSAI
jgi:hypothetical protein